MIAQAPPPSAPVAISIAKSCPGKQVDLNTGIALDGTEATDFGPCINKLLEGAAPGHTITLLVDGSFAVSGVYGPVAGHWHLVGQGGGMDGANLHGTGFFQIAGTNGDVIHNGGKHLYEPGQPGRPAERGEDVVLENFVINGNRRDGTHGNNTSGDPRLSAAGGWTFGIALHSLNHVRVTGLFTYNIASFNILFDDIGHGEFNHSTCANTGIRGSVALGQNGDCWHVDGPANDLRSTDVLCRATDDCFALNAPESVGGVIERVTISNWTMDARTCGRMYTGSTANRNGVQLAAPTVQDVEIHSVQCESRSWAVMFGAADFEAQPITKPNSITGVRVTDSTFSSPFGFIVSDSIGDLSITHTTLSDLKCKHDGLAQPACGFVQVALNRAVPIRHLSLVDNTLRFTPGGHAGTAGAVTTEGGWNSGKGDRTGSAQFSFLEIRGFRKVNEGGAFPPLAQLITLDAGSTIEKLDLNDIDAATIQAITNEPAQIHAVNGRYAIPSAPAAPAADAGTAQ